MTLKRIVPIALLALTLSAPVALAQAPEPITALADPNTAVAAPSTALPAATAGPRLDLTRSTITVARDAVARDAVARDATSGAFDPLPQPTISRKRGVPQMIIGGAAILGGAIVGGDAGGIVSLAGLGYGLYGLYLYLQ